MTEPALTPTHELSDVHVSRMTLVKKGANRRRFFLRKSAEDAPEAFGGQPAPLLKASPDWRTAYVVVAEPGWVEEGGQGAGGIADVWKSADEIEKAAHDFMAAGGDVNRLIHGSPTDPNLRIVENAVALADFEVDGHTIAKGSWYVGVRLDDAARAMVESGEITGVSIEGSGMRAPIGKAAPSPRSVMVALYPEPSLADALAVEHGEAPEDLHVTLAYLGDVSDDRVHLVVDAAQRAVDGIDTDGLTGEIAGAGTFTSGPKPVHYASVDLPSLPKLRQRLVGRLADAGVPAMQDHGFTPHMTLKVGRGPTPRVASRPVRFGQLHVVRGDRDVATIPLTPNTVPDVPMLKDGGPKLPIPNKPGVTNWVERKGGFPPYIRDVIEHMLGQGVAPVDKAIERGLGIVKNWKDGHDGKGHKVSAATQTKAAAAWAAYTSKGKVSTVSKVIDALKKALTPGVQESDLTDDERRIIEKVASEASGSAEDPATLGKNQPSGDTTEDHMDPQEITKAVAEGMKPLAEQVATLATDVATLKKAAEPEPKAPTLEEIQKTQDAVVDAVLKLNKSVETLASGASTQTPERGGEREPVAKSTEAPAGGLTGIFSV